MFGKDEVFFEPEVRVLCEDVFGSVAGQLQDLPVPAQVGNFQVERDTALPGTLNVAGATQFQVHLGNLESIIGSHHRIDPLPALFGYLVSSHQNAIGLIGPTSGPSTKLMHLGKARDILSYPSEERLYISSVESDAKSFNPFIRQHREVENSLHWTLDVTSDLLNRLWG